MWWSDRHGGDGRGAGDRWRWRWLARWPAASSRSTATARRTAAPSLRDALSCSRHPADRRAQGDRRRTAGGRDSQCADFRLHRRRLPGAADPSAEDRDLFHPDLGHRRHQHVAARRRELRHQRHLHADRGRQRKNRGDRPDLRARVLRYPGPAAALCACPRLARRRKPRRQGDRREHPFAARLLFRRRHLICPSRCRRPLPRTSPACLCVRGRLDTRFASMTTEDAAVASIHGRAEICRHRTLSRAARSGSSGRAGVRSRRRAGARARRAADQGFGRRPERPV